MDSVREQYYRYHILLLSAVGLWPYGNKKVRQTQYAIIIVLFFYSILIQLIPFITMKYTFRLFLKNIAPVLATIAVTFKYITFWQIAENVKQLAHDIEFDWNRLKNKEELEIIERNTQIGIFRRKVFAMIIYPAASCLAVCPFASIILDIVVPLNQSRPYQFPVVYQTFFSQQTYFLYHVTVFLILIIISAIIIVETEAVIIMSFQHGCGLFEITSYRFHKALTDCEINFHRTHQSEIYLKIIEAIRIHLRALRFTNYVVASFSTSYFILLWGGIIAFTINLYRLSESILIFNDIDEFVISTMFTIAIVEYLFYLNYVSQGLTDVSGDIFRDLYCSTWYEAPIPVKKLLQFVFLKALKPVTFGWPGFYVASIEGFSTTIQLALSYFTVLHSTQTT